MKVIMIDHSSNPIGTIYKAFRTCYSPNTPSTIKCPDKDAMLDFIHAHLNHESPIEHAVFTFSIEGVSRACTHQLVRHRIASYSQQSQRYVKADQFEYEIPDRIKDNPKALTIYHDLMMRDQLAYNSIFDLLNEDGFNKEQCAEDARMVLPNACKSNIVVTMNGRSLMNFFHERLCSRAQWEIRAVAIEMRQLAHDLLPIYGMDSAMKCGKTCFDCANAHN